MTDEYEKLCITHIDTNSKMTLAVRPVKGKGKWTPVIGANEILIRFLNQYGSQRYVDKEFTLESVIEGDD